MAKHCIAVVMPQKHYVQNFKTFDDVPFLVGILPTLVCKAVLVELEPKRGDVGNFLTFAIFTFKSRFELLLMS